jgi:hypothetical protein
MYKRNAGFNAKFKELIIKKRIVKLKVKYSKSRHFAYI